MAKEKKKPEDYVPQHIVQYMYDFMKARGAL